MSVHSLDLLPGLTLSSVIWFALTTILHGCGVLLSVKTEEQKTGARNEAS